MLVASCITRMEERLRWWKCVSYNIWSPRRWLSHGYQVYKLISCFSYHRWSHLDSKLGFHPRGQPRDGTAQDDRRPFRSWSRSLSHFCKWISNFTRKQDVDLYTLYTYIVRVSGSEINSILFLAFSLASGFARPLSIFLVSLPVRRRNFLRRDETRGEDVAARRCKCNRDRSVSSEWSRRSGKVIRIISGRTDEPQTAPATSHARDVSMEVHSRYRLLQRQRYGLLTRGTMMMVSPDIQGGPQRDRRAWRRPALVVSHSRFRRSSFEHLDLVWPRSILNRSLAEFPESPWWCSAYRYTYLNDRARKSDRPITGESDAIPFLLKFDKNRCYRRDGRRLR